jgi:hypothetical protein
MEEARNMCRILMVKPLEKRPLGIPKRRREINRQRQIRLLLGDFETLAFFTRELIF